MDPITVRPRNARLPNQTSFLSLPFEIREQIYLYLLPTTRVDRFLDEYIWIKGSTSVLRVNHQIYHEAISVLFNRAMVEVKVELLLDGCRRNFYVRNVSPLGAITYRNLPFPESFGAQNLHRIRRLKVSIYYSVRGRHFQMRDIEDHSVRKVESLCLILQRIARLKLLHIEYEPIVWPDWLDKPPASTVLGPFKILQNVDHVKIEGRVDEPFKSELQSILEGSYSRATANGH